MLNIADHFTPDADIILHLGEALDYLKTLPDNIISLIITSPPYNIGKDYEKQVTLTDYLNSQKPMIQELCRVLKEDGSICWQVGNYVKNGEVFPLDIYYYDLFKQANLFLRNRIIWHYGHGLHAQKRFSGRYETILWFTKSDRYIFNLDAVRVPSKYPGKRHYKGANKGKPSGNINGKNPSDVWEILVDDWQSAVWNIPNVKSNHPEKTAHPCQYPVELVERCVLALTNENDWVLDPFAGAGSSIIASIKNQRRAMGCEKLPEYMNITGDRLQSYQAGTLKTRPLGKPVHIPTGREKVSQIPTEWQEN
ncbi:MAG: DNA-methyltransferase [Microcoleaceae cyanobacterium]